MAISITKLTETAVENQADTLKEWLDNNAKGTYFTDVTMADGVITCYIGEEKILELGVANGNYRCSVYIKYDNSTRRFRSYSQASAKVFKTLVKTSKGIMISWLNYSSNAVYDSVWISKSNINTTGILIFAQNDSQATSGYVGIADFDLSTSGSQIFSGSFTAADFTKFCGIASYSYSSLNPISLTQNESVTPSYMPNVHLFKFRQTTTRGLYKMTLDGAEYFSDGIVAMRS